VFVEILPYFSKFSQPLQQHQIPEPIHLDYCAVSVGMWDIFQNANRLVGKALCSVINLVDSFGEIKKGKPGSCQASRRRLSYAAKTTAWILGARGEAVNLRRRQQAITTRYAT